MVRKNLTPEQIINKLGEAEALLSQGDTIGEASKKIDKKGAINNLFRGVDCH